MHVSLNVNAFAAVGFMLCCFFCFKLLLYHSWWIKMIIIIQLTERSRRLTLRSLVDCRWFFCRARHHTSPQILCVIRPCQSTQLNKQLNVGTYGFAGLSFCCRTVRARLLLQLRCHWRRICARAHRLAFARSWINQYIRSLRSDCVSPAYDIRFAFYRLFAGSYIRLNKVSKEKRVCGQLRSNVTSSITPEVHDVSQRRQMRIEPRPQGICTKNS